MLENVLDPILCIRPGDAGYAATLAARLHRRRGPAFLEAPSLACNWVCGEGLICPLPRDVVTFAAAMLDGLRPDGLSFPEVIALRRRSGEVSVEIDAAALVTANDAAGEAGPIAVPGLNAVPFPYQAHGIAWMHKTVSRTGGLVLADEMGLGKTLQIIALFLLAPPSHDCPALVLCPTTLIANWVRELARFAPGLDVMVHRGADRARLHTQLRRSSVLLTTYDTLVNDLVLFKAVDWSWLVCDEAQAIKNPDSQRRMAVGELDRQRAIPVTGTPVENHLLDLWSLVDVAIPGLLGDRRSFESMYPDTEASARELAHITNPVVLKRRVKDVASDLPERMDVMVPVELGERLSCVYEDVRQQALEKYPRAGAMVATGQLQLFCAHPSLAAPDPDSAGWEDAAVLVADHSVDVMTPKLERTAQLIEEAFANRRKVLVFCNFNACGPIIQRSVAGYPYAFWGAINGTTPSSQRQTIVDEFSAHDGPGVLILNPRAAGAGLNITAATTVIHYTQVWNPALEQQASARAHRRGQVNPVTIYHMYYTGTVEEVMMERAQRRRELGSEAVPTTTQEAADLARAMALSPAGRS